LKKLLFTLLTFGLVLTGGCAISQTVNPAGITISGAEICIIEDTSVKQGFLTEYRRWLEGRGAIVKTLPQRASIRDCPIVSTYLAKWSWDLTIYMSYAEIKVYQDGVLSGDALYDSRSGGGNMGKFIDAEEKIQELASQLFL